MMNRIEKALCEVGNTKIPRSLTIKETDKYILLILDGKRIQTENMQKPCNAFEGWAMALHICAKNLGIRKNVCMDLDDKTHFVYDRYEGSGHLGRFLYRAMRFSQQYGDWFALSDYLKNEVEKFEHYLKANEFVNNIAKGRAGSKKKNAAENEVEEILSRPGTLQSVIKGIDVGDNSVYRQLPVGLFIGDVAKENMVFTGGKSAIDLWTKNGDKINIVELKTLNIMMGIVTEIFFYSNYIYDLTSENGLFEMSEPPKDTTERRGYEELYYDRPKIVNGIMLADNGNFHPWVKDGMLAVLNDNKMENLNYFLESYYFGVVVK